MEHFTRRYSSNFFQKQIYFAGKDLDKNFDELKDFSNDCVDAINALNIDLVPGSDQLENQNKFYMAKIGGGEFSYVADENIAPEKLSGNVLQDATLTSPKVAPGGINVDRLNQEQITNFIKSLIEEALEAWEIPGNQIEVGSITKAAINLDSSFDLYYPTGSIWGFSKDSAPVGFCPADGRALNRVTFSKLFAYLGVTYGAGDRSTTFNVPDYRGFALAGMNNGSAGGRLSALSFPTGIGVSKVGGTESTAVSLAQLPNFALQYLRRQGTGVTVYNAGAGIGDVNLEEATQNTSSVGAGSPLSVVQPTVGVAFFISTGENKNVP